MEVFPVGGGDEGGGVSGGGYIHLTLPQHIHIVNFYQVHYVLVSGGREAPGVTGVQAVVVAGRPGLGSIDGNYPFFVTKTL